MLNLKRSGKRSFILCFCLSISCLFFPISFSFAGDSELEIEKAVYKEEESRLRVVVKREGDDRQKAKITLFDNVLNKVIAEEENSKEEIKFTLVPIIGSEVPCSVRVEVNGLSITRNVKHAPTNCSQTPEEGGGGASGENASLSCSIIKPAQNVSITLGSSVDFEGTSSAPEGAILSYEWAFSGGADIRPTVEIPGAIVFDQNNGQYLVTYTVTDDQGTRCSDTVSVLVGELPSGLPAKASEVPAPGTLAAGDKKHVVLPYNDLGMHCGDFSTYPFSVLPPFNNVNAQFLLKGTTGVNRPVLLDNVNYQVQYSAASNPNDPIGPGSINSTSQNFPIGSSAEAAIIRKTDFWDALNADETIVSSLFGIDLLPDVGLAGATMPGILSPYFLNYPQIFNDFDADKLWFTALGIPMVGVDDIGRLNSYPIMRVQGIDKHSGIVLATTDVVVPVSSEVDCRDCHAKGQIGADDTVRIGIPGAPVYVEPASPNRPDVELAAKENIILLHNFKHGTEFLKDDRPVLCASCHSSNALGTAGLPGVASMSNVMHGHHGKLQIDEAGNLLRDERGEPIFTIPQQLTGNEKPLIAFGPGIPMEENCFLCHPGKITQCFRGAMYTAGQQCEDCHGGMLAVGGEYPLKGGAAREPWVDEPRCESCHTGHGDEPVLTKAFDVNDPAATPLPAVRKRFAENTNELYRNSLGHGGVGCEGCHGSPHAIWPNRDPNANDNVTAVQLQGHAGTIRECTVCHEQDSFPTGTLDGPHGMHPVNDPKWIKSKDDLWHEDYVKDENGNDQCAACHGADHKGTRLSKVPVDRVLKDEDGVVRATLSAGDIVSCDLCHDLEKSFDN